MVAPNKRKKSLINQYLMKQVAIWRNVLPLAYIISFHEVYKMHTRKTERRTISFNVSKKTNIPYNCMGFAANILKNFPPTTG